jgi:tetratricopeptide (TPR) repeat protein
MNKAAVMTKSVVWWGVTRSCSILWVEFLIWARRYEAASRDVRRMYSASPTNHSEMSEMNAHLAWIEEYRGRFDRAADYLNLALQIRPNDAFRNWEIGLIYQKLGKPNLAIEAFERSLNFGAEFGAEFRERLKQEIEELRLSMRV